MSPVSTGTIAPIEDSDAAPPGAKLIEWKPWTHSSGSLAGHAAIAFSGGWNVAKIPIFRDRNGNLSAGVPSIPEIDGDGRVRSRPDGSRIYWPVITFADGTARVRWRRAVLAALAASGVMP